MDRMASLTAFVRVVESGGFTAAARRLDLSTTTVSNHVQALEDSLGVRLLNRTTRHVSLTEIGREYYERCSHILQELAEADEITSALQVTPRGRLRLRCHQSLDRFIAPVVTRFLGNYPEVSLDFETDVMIDPVREGFDLSIMPASPPDSTLIRRTLAKWHYLLCCAPAYLETHSVPHSPADLVDHNCLLYAYSIFRNEFHFVDPAGNPMSTRVSGNMVTASITVMRAAAAAGLGLWLCPPFLVSDLLASGALVPLLPDYRTQELEIVALYPHRRQVSTKVRLLLDMLVDRFAEEQRWLDAMPDR
ncbi:MULTISPECIES: LysR family transcriptional regulator [Cupriavidus]|uniref:Regulatory protein, LysR:LysR, substrate-binding protein n=1 Tax=Cupriavidus pinatubonensis (strain JMP 134 / LMG 1197) TaxID=264198 RepID=Q471T4_CUPPJ|nr:MULTISPECIES: LysR family transcriptional regulator [Cupriavidus]QYY33040.1 LysR family transcriptional regulator [Cupriavidus pinatubonensis]TPQ39134.1 LysR family transcriptional regulator [Cupriavidus pinatubonensis]